MTLDLYGQNILEHYKNPINRGNLTDATARIHESNPLCGDELDVSITVEDDRVADAKFDGDGCAISLASADIIIDQIKNESVKEVAILDKEKFIKSLGIELSALRLKCALLAFKAVKLVALQIMSKSEFK